MKMGLVCGCIVASVQMKFLLISKIIICAIFIDSVDYIANMSCRLSSTIFDWDEWVCSWRWQQLRRCVDFRINWKVCSSEISVFAHTDTFCMCYFSFNKMWNENTENEVSQQIKSPRDFQNNGLYRCVSIHGMLMFRSLQRTTVKDEGKSSESDGLIISFYTFKIILNALSHEIASEKGRRVTYTRRVCIEHVKDIYGRWHCNCFLEEIFFLLFEIVYCILQTRTIYVIIIESRMRLGWNFLLSAHHHQHWNLKILEECKMINDYDGMDNRENASLLVGSDIVWCRQSPPTTLDAICPE